MSTLAPRIDAHAIDVCVDDALIRFVLADGREIAAPTAWFPRSLDATPEARANWRPIGRGVGVHWPDIDADIAVKTLMRAR